MKFDTLHLFTAGIALSLSLTACGTSEGSDDLSDALDSIAAQAEQTALREHGVDQAEQDAAAADEAAGAELGDEAEEAPAPGERIAAFCADRSAEVLARCEGAEARPEDAPSCDDVAARAEEQCIRRAVRHVRHRMEAHNNGCRDEARQAAQACHDDGGDRATCRQAAMDAGRACIEASPDRPREDGEEGAGRPERPQPPAGEEGGAEGAGRPERPQPPAGEEGGAEGRPERPQPPADGQVDPCREAAHAAGQACIDGGGTPEDCRAAGMEAGRACIEANGGELPPPPPPADGGAGGDRPQPPPPDGQVDPCREAAHAAGQACIDEGGTPEECRAAGMEAGRACIEANGGELPPPPPAGGDRQQPPPPAGDRQQPPPPAGGDRQQPPPDGQVDPCREAAHAAGQACIDDGGTPEACREAAMAAGRACLAAQ